MEEWRYVRRLIYPLQSDLPVLGSVRELHQRTPVHSLRIWWLWHGQHVGEDLRALQACSVHPESVLFVFEDNVAVTEPKRRRGVVRRAAKSPPLRGREERVVWRALPHAWSRALCSGSCEERVACVQLANCKQRLGRGCGTGNALAGPRKSVAFYGDCHICDPRGDGSGPAFTSPFISEQALEQQPHPSSILHSPYPLFTRVLLTAMVRSVLLLLWTVSDGLSQSVSPAVLRRLMRELSELQTNPSEGIRVATSEDNMLDVTGIVEGPGM